MIRVGVDTGGTFTDLVSLDETTGELAFGKQPSTPDDPARGVCEAFGVAGVDPREAAGVVLGTTVATNAMLERRGARVLYVTTAGFEDVLQIGRVDKKDPYDLRWPKPRPLVARRDCHGVRERIDADGTIVAPLGEEDLDEVERWVGERLADDGSVPVAVAVNLLFSYANPAHERLLAARLRSRFPGLPVSVSHEVAPVWREVERGATTVADAFLAPVVARLVHDCERGLAELGCSGPLTLMKSNGGQLEAASAAARPAQLLLSGLAGGIVAGRFFGERAGTRSLVTLDMGGTSADVGLVRDGAIGYVDGVELEWGLPVVAASIDLATIGAGGGSIAWVDEGGLLRVGPRSAGAVPGPVCYGLGGDEVTVTDANLVLGRLDPEYFLGGRIRLDAAAAGAKVTELGARLGLSAAETAHAIVEIANESMASAVRAFAVDRGLDPRDLDLVAFGGAGPLHGAEVAAALGMRDVVVPPRPGLASAFGTLVADRRVDRRWTHVERADLLDVAALDAKLSELTAGAIAELAAEGFAGEPTVLRSLSMRYLGQNYEQDVPIGPGRLDGAALAAALAAFGELHEAFHGYAFADETVEVVQLNVTALGVSSPPVLAQPAPAAPVPPAAERDVFLPGAGFAPTRIYRRAELGLGFATDGPAVIEQDDSTVLVLPSQRVEVVADGILRLTWREQQAPPARSRTVDAVTMSVVQDHLVAIAQEMGSHMMRTSYSPIFSESRDFSCALFTARGELIGQGFFCPAQLGAIVHTVEVVLDELGVDTFEPGDVVVHNDPYRGGCHMPEHMLLRPIFAGDELVAFAATIGHLAEIGAAAVGSFASDATEVFQEGLRLPPVKLVRRDEPADDVWKIILSNHRTPRASWGDLHAMIGSLKVGERRFLELVDRLGLDVVKQSCAALIAYAERLVAARIAELPQGEYTFTDAMEDDGITDEPVGLRVRVSVLGDRLLVDYTGTDTQARGPVNATFGVTTSASINALLQLVGRDVPRNHGAYRRVKTIAPIGSAVNVRFPGPSVGGNTETQPKLVGMILGALAPALPERVMAAEGVTSCNFLFGGVHPRTGEPYAHYHFEASGWGGQHGKDGNSAQNHIHGNCRNTPVEVFETRFPFRIERYELIPDSGGGGRRRGGLATRRVLRVTAPLTVSAFMDRVREGAWGLFGGLPGRPAAIMVRRAGRAEFEPFTEAFGTVSPSKFANVVLEDGDEVMIESAGGGGYGDPREREPELVVRDVLDGFVTPDAAERVYGIAVVDGALDAERTRAARAGR